MNELILHRTYNKTQLIDIIRENKKVNMLEKYTKTELRNMAIGKDYTKPELIELLTTI
jgi:hypothetical protein